MTAPSGLSAQLTLAEEVTYGVPVTPARALDLVSETINLPIQRIESKGLRAGRRVLVSQQWDPGKRGPAIGDLALELANVNMGLLWKHALGAVATAGSAGVGYTHTCTPGDLTGKSLTVQIGRPDVTGVIRPFTYTGCKINAWDLACKAGEIANLKVTVAAQNEVMSRAVSDGVTTGTNSSPVFTSATGAFTAADVGLPIGDGGVKIPVATTILSVQSATSVTMSANALTAGASLSVTIGVPLAPAVYPTTMGPMTFVGGSLQLGGTQVDVRDVTLKGNNQLDVGRFYLRNSATVKEPLEHQWRDYTAVATADFADLVQYNRFLSAAEVAMVLTFAGPPIVGTAPLVNYSTTITMNVRYDGNTPNVAGPAILTQPIQLKAVASGASDASAISVAYVTSDVLP